MQIMSRIILLLAVITMTGCSVEENVSPVQVDMYLRLLTPSGTNIADSLNFVPEGVWSSQKTEKGLVNLNVIWHSKGPSFAQETYWIRLSNRGSEKFRDRETMLLVRDLDFVHRLQSCGDMEIYEYQISSQKLFGTNECHIIKWYIQIHGEHGIDAVKCELDGQAVDLSDDPYYNAYISKGHHPASGVINVVVPDAQGRDSLDADTMTVSKSDLSDL